MITGIGLQRLAEGRTVHHGHLAVGHDQLGRELARPGQPILAVNGRADFVAVVPEQRGDHLPHQRTVLNQWQSSRHVSSTPNRCSSFVSSRS